MTQGIHHVTAIAGAVRRNLGLDEAHTVETIAEYGNSSAATIPFSMALAAEAAPFRKVAVADEA